MVLQNHFSKSLPSKNLSAEIAKQARQSIIVFLYYKSALYFDEVLFFTISWDEISTKYKKAYF